MLRTKLCAFVFAASVITFALIVLTFHPDDISAATNVNNFRLGHVTVTHSVAIKPTPSHKEVFLWTGWKVARHIFEGPMVNDYVGFTSQNCKKTCTAKLQYHNEDHSSASLIVFYYNDMPHVPPKKYPNQVWMFRTGEPQFIKSSFPHAAYNGMFNYTQSFKTASTHGIHFGQTFKRESETEHVNWADRKRSNDGVDLLEPKVLWFVSNCHNTVSSREAYANELLKHIDMTIHSGSADCKRRLAKVVTGGPERGSANEYKGYPFYLSFENSRCSDYITEKFWKILLSDSLVIPVVLGGGENSLDEYSKIAPPNSYLHVLNFTSPAHLAEHIRRVVKDDAAFNFYHEWRQKWRVQSGERVEDDAAKLCEMCELAHEQPESVVASFEDHYSPHKQCIDIRGKECQHYNICNNRTI